MKYSIIYDQVLLICLPIYYLFSHMFSSRSHIYLQRDNGMFCWNKNVWGSKHENPQCHLVVTYARLMKSNISVKHWFSHEWCHRSFDFFTNVSYQKFESVYAYLQFFVKDNMIYDMNHILLITFCQFYDVVLFMRHQIIMTLKHFNTRR